MNTSRRNEQSGKEQNKINNFKEIMMGNSKAKEIYNAMKDFKKSVSLTFKISGKDFVVNFNMDATLDDMMHFQEVCAVGVVISTESDAVLYNPSIKTYALNRAIFEVFSDVDLLEVSEDANTELFSYLNSADCTNTFNSEEEVARWYDWLGNIAASIIENKLSSERADKAMFTVAAMMDCGAQVQQLQNMVEGLSGLAESVKSSKYSFDDLVDISKKISEAGGDDIVARVLKESEKGKKSKILDFLKKN